MNPVLEVIFDSNQVLNERGEPTPLRWAVSLDEGMFLQQTIATLKPQVALEVGLAFGVSALFICEALEEIPGGRLIAIDPFQFEEWEGIGMANLKKAGYASMVELINKTSQAALPQLVDRGLRIDFAFIDGLHTFDHALVDFFYIDQLLRIGGVVIFDDTNFKSIRKVARFIATNRSYSVYGFQSNRPTMFRYKLLGSMSGLGRRLRRVLRPELAEPDASFGWAQSSRCIAFKKEADDTRQGLVDGHRQF